MNTRINKIVYNVMLLSMLHSSLVAPAQDMVYAYFNREEGVRYKGFKKAEEQYPVLDNHQQEEAEMHQSPAYSQPVKSGIPVMEEMMESDIKHGFIGATTEKPLDDATDNIFKVMVNSMPDQQSKVYLVYELYGLQDYRGVSRSINDRLSTGGHIIKNQQGWTLQKEEIDAAWLKQGENRIMFSIPQGANLQYQVKNLRIEFGKSENSSFLPVLATSSPTVNYIKDNKLYVKGFLRNLPSKGVSVFIENSKLSFNDGEFEGFLELTPELKQRKFAIIKAVDGNGLLGQEMINFDNLIEADKLFPIEVYPEKATVTLNAKKAGFLKTEGASIVINDSALAEQKEISISRLRRVDVAPMASGMVNVTKGRAAYRFLPDGIRFDKKVSISIEYDEHLIPKGYSAKDIKTFYFNTNTKAWIPVTKDTLNEKEKTVTSLTDHFTDYINGIIQTPESPETAGFTPTMMNDIKAADPSAEITLISPPEVSQKGEANISYPIKIPSGRNGMQPQIALQYNSDGGSGWIGQGWNINIPAISIDTRWGTPEINNTHETVIYTLAGEQLMYPKFKNASNVDVDWMPNRQYDSTSVLISTSPRAKITNAKFTPRKQGSFSKIERLGASPDLYIWKVTNTDGTVSWYGGKTGQGTNGVVEDAVIKNTAGQIVYWALYMTEDVHLNNIKYTYLKETISASQTGERASLSSGIIHNINKINYTGHNNGTGLYEIEFKRSLFPSPNILRKDVTIDAKLGAKLVDPCRLNEILIRRTGSTTLIRRYGFFFKEGEFQKTLLDYVAEYDRQGAEFYRHTFDYYNDVRNGSEVALFDRSYNVKVPNPTPSYTLGIGSLLGSSKLNSTQSIEAGWGINLSAGLQFRLWDENNDPYGTLTLNFPLGESYPKDRGFVTMADIDGDGLDDVIYKSSNGLRYFPSFFNQETGKFEFGAEKNIAGITNFSTSEGRTKTMFLETFNMKAKIPFANKEFFFGRFRTKTDMKTDIYFTDGNGDGLLDIVKDKMVLFNQPDSVTGGRKFTTSSEQTPNMLITASTNQIPDIDIEEEGEFDGAQDYDAVRVWIAPKAGLIRIDDIVSLNTTDANSKTYYSIETSKPTINNGIPFRLYLTQLTSTTGATVAVTTYAGNNPALGSLNNSSLQVDKGQKIFFRITKNAEGKNDEVTTNPTIKYLNETDVKLLKDENELDHLQSSFQDGFILSESQAFNIPSSGTLNISWDDVEVDTPSDMVTYSIILETEAGSDILYYSTVNQGDIGYISRYYNQKPGGHNFANPLSVSLDASRGEKKRIRFEVTSSSNVKWKEIQWKPTLTFTSNTTTAAPGMVSLPIVRYPVAKYSIFKTNLLRKLAPVAGWTVPNSVVTYGIKPNVIDVFDPGDNGIFTMIVKKAGMVVDQRTIEVTNGDVSVSDSSPILLSTPINLTVAANQFHYSVGYYITTSSDEALFNKYMLATNFKTAIVGYNWSLPANNAGYLPLFVESKYNNLDYLGPLHREWGQFFYNDGLDQSLTIPSDAIGKLINPNIGDRYNALLNAFGTIDPSNPCFNEPSDQQISDCLEEQYISDLNLPPDVTPDNIDTISFDDLFTPAVQEAAITPLLSSRASRAYPTIQGSATEVEKWIGLFDSQYVRETKVKAGSFAGSTFDMIFPDEDTSSVEQADLKKGMQAINKNRISVSVSNTGGWGPLNLSKSQSSYSYTTSDFIDINGDRYPDLMSSESVQLTKMTGGHKPPVTHTYGHLNSGENDAIRVTVQGGSQDLGRKEGPKAPTTSASTVQNNSTTTQTSSTANTTTTTGDTASTDSQEGAAKKDQGNPAFSMGIGVDANLDGQNKEKALWTDLNGDGLPDKVIDEGNGFKFKLNTGGSINNVSELGYNFIANPDASLSANKPTALSLSLNFGLNVNSLFEDVELPVDINFSAGISNSGSTGKSSLLDLNGDGLPDLLDVNEGAGSLYINNGNGFSSTSIPLLVNGSTLTMEEESKTTSLSVAGDASIYTGWTICCAFFFFYLPLLHIKAGASGSGNANLSLTNAQKAFKDFNGDGYMDYIERDGNELKVYQSKIARTNKLRTVTNPLKGTFTIDYKVEKTTYDNPNPKWVMSKLEVEDGYNKTNDGVDKYVKEFTYENAKYDRRERVFYGFETVREKNAFRTVVSKYHNTNYFLNGLLKESYVIAGSNEAQKYSRTENTYQIRQLSATNAALTSTVLPTTFDEGGTEGRRSAAVVLTQTKNYLYELSSTPLLTTQVNFQYDTLGRVVTYINQGNIADSSDNYTTAITYHTGTLLTTRHILNVPASITVSAPSMIRKRTTTVDNNTGKILTINAYSTLSAFSTTTMVYDAFGNLSEIYYPPNDNPTPQSMSYRYSYDSNNYKIVAIRDAFDYISQTSYYLATAPTDHFYYDNDKVIKTTDLAGNLTQYEYDYFGRLRTIRAPKESLTSVPPTIRFDYYLKRTSLPAGNGISTDGEFVPVAVSSHYDVNNPTNLIETLTFIDGLARPMQVKKDIVRNIGTTQSPNYQESLSISGWSTYDNLGRVVRQFHPHFEAKVANTKFKVNQTTTGFATLTEYDAIDRPVAMEDEEGNPTEISYSIAQDNFGTTAMKTHTEVAQNGSQNIISESYKNVLGKVVSTMNEGPGGAIWTKFTYNPIGELTSYMDAAGITTSYGYDRLGRKVAVNHPDNGTTTFKYDAASNLTHIQTANLANDTSIPVNDRYIKYVYDINRVKEILYPNTPSGLNLSNVYYEYGAYTLTGAEANKRGRLTKQTDATGEQHFEYGNMGEVTKNTRIVSGPNIPTRIFEMVFDYDSFNRLLHMVYPDGERLFYNYDLGGNLYSIRNNSGYDYIKRIDYDHFEQRSYLLYGNNTETFYTYTASLRRLKNLNVKTSNQQDLFANTYKYDKIGNVIELENTAGTNNTMGGGYNHSFTYDNLNRLDTATGEFNGDTAQGSLGNDFQSGYFTRMAYNDTHGITEKTQRHFKNNVPHVPNTYEHVYRYEDGTHKLREVVSGNTLIEALDYDHNGNIKIRNKLVQADVYFWDESNRLRVVLANQNMQHYIYDASGERVLKASSDSESVYENGSLTNPSSININSYTTYPSAFMVIDPNGIYSKHYYAGTQRIVSRLGESAKIFDLKQKKAAVTKGDDKAFDDEALRQSQIADLQKYLDAAKLGKATFKEYKETTYQEEEQILKEEAIEDEGENNPEVKRAIEPSAPIYYYHPDHLGTSTFLTDANGNPYQFFLNLPFGETMAEQLPSSYYKTPFKFSGKEMDEETGLHYFGARYYDSRISIWMSVDPLAESFPNWNPYNYTMQNPINLLDPDGRSVYPPGGFPREDGATHTDSDGSWIYSASDNIWKGQNGSEDYSNAIQLDEVQVSSPKYDGYLSGYFNGKPSGEYGPSKDPTLAYAVIGIVAAPVAIEIGGAYLLAEAIAAYRATSATSALVGIGTNTLSQGMANGGDFTQVNAIEAVSSAFPGIGPTIVGETFSYSYDNWDNGKGIQTPKSFEHGLLQISGGLFSNNFGNKIDANPLFNSSVSKTYKEMAKFSVETGTNVLPNLADKTQKP